MIHAGQEYGRSKVIEVNAVPDNHQGRIDHNSYNKDNSTNYLNYDIAEINEELIDIYKNFFEIRKEYPELRKTPRDQLSPFYADSEFGIGYRIRARGKTRELLVLVNGSHEKPAYYSLPNGSWKIVTQTSSQIPAPAGISYLLPPASGVILELK